MVKTLCVYKHCVLVKGRLLEGGWSCLKGLEKCCMVVQNNEGLLEPGLYDAVKWIRKSQM